jgi:hypothetical protein
LETVEPGRLREFESHPVAQLCGLVGLLLLNTGAGDPSATAHQIPSHADVKSRVSITACAEPLTTTTITLSSAAKRSASPLVSLRCI